MDKATKRAIRHSFQRAADRYDEAAFLQHEVARRLDDHLDGVKIEPKRILDAGCGTGFGSSLLRARYPRADVVGLDLADAMLHQAAARLRGSVWEKLRARLMPNVPNFFPLCGDIEHLPLSRGSFDMAWSSLALQWVGGGADGLQTSFKEMHRVLKPGGLFIFASFGPDTLKELRAASADMDGHQHVNRFIDMHDVGDALVHAGFSNPVMEMEQITLTYADLAALLRDLKAIGAHTVLEGRREGLMGKSAWRRLLLNYETFRQNERLPASYEVVYGHAWAERAQKTEDGRQIIEFRKR
ncbi:MAG: malonyl-[acyl-carrier protein] O-methyltransferase BioC [Hydrogenophilales bacterium 28-61-23]|nr:MAG: malonyl-[acyl-carrier protein] O-methyltransferase BioC [Hydrogenophilales bacterium 28-61-23]